MPEFKLATRPKPRDLFDAPIANSELSTFKLAKRQTPQTDSAFEAMCGSGQEAGTFQKRRPFVKSAPRFKRGDRIRIRGREHEVLHIEPFPEGRSYVHARSAAGDIQDFFPDSEIHAA